MSRLPDTSLIPFVQPDGKGYRLGDEARDGFDDRPDLGVATRIRIAKMASAYTPTVLTDVQKQLIAAGTPSRADIAILQALADDEAFLSSPYMADLIGLVPEQQKALAATPSLHAKLAGRIYPLKIEDAAQLVGVTKRQLRLWDENRYVPAYRLGRHRRYFRGTVLLAMAVKRLKPYERSVLRSLLRGEGKTLLSITAASAMAARSEATLRVVFTEIYDAASLLREATFRVEPVVWIRAAPKPSDEWEVAEVDLRSLAICDTREMALSQAREIAKDRGWRLEIHGKDGQINTEASFAP